MKKYDIEESEIFSLLTSKQIALLSDIAVIKNFEEGEVIYDQKEKADSIFILLEGEVSLRLPGKNDISAETFSSEIEKIYKHGTLFGTNYLFGVKRYVSRAKVLKSAKIMILDGEKFLNIIRENKSEFVIMAYLAKVYFHRYVNAMKEIEKYSEKVC